MINPCYPLIQRVLPRLMSGGGAPWRRVHHAHRATGVGHGGAHHGPVHGAAGHHAPLYGPPAPPVAVNCARAPGGLPAGPGLAAPGIGGAGAGGLGAVAKAAALGGAVALGAAGIYGAASGGGVGPSYAERGAPGSASSVPGSGPGVSGGAGPGVFLPVVGGPRGPVMDLTPGGPGELMPVGGGPGQPSAPDVPVVQVPETPTTDTPNVVAEPGSLALLLGSVGVTLAVGFSLRTGSSPKRR